VPQEAKAKAYPIMLRGLALNLLESAYRAVY